MKRIVLFFTALAVVGALVMSATASAAPERNAPVGGVTSPSLLALITNDVFSTADLSWLLEGLAASPLQTNAASSSAGSNSTQHYGPYTTQDTDSSTCGNDWATDTFDRHFTVKPNRTARSRWWSSSRTAAS
ncbi:MAG TPA: hypothetical protein VGP69_05725 [Gaiellaceae bacterium]|jgi:hypothetical protein|nr:hypothetical protein [Gaiellaceae bacterium]